MTRKQISQNYTPCKVRVAETPRNVLLERLDTLRKELFIYPKNLIKWKQNKNRY